MRHGWNTRSGVYRYCVNEKKPTLIFPYILVKSLFFRRELRPCSGSNIAARRPRTCNWNLPDGDFAVRRVLCLRTLPWGQPSPRNASVWPVPSGSSVTHKNTFYFYRVKKNVARLIARRLPERISSDCSVPFGIFSRPDPVDPNRQCQITTYGFRHVIGEF